MEWNSFQIIIKKIKKHAKFYKDRWEKPATITIL